MKNFQSFFVFIFSTLVICSCSSGKSAFKKGNYYDATLKSVYTLRSKPDSKKALETIQQSYPMALDYYRQKINAYTTLNDQDKYYNIVETYVLLNKLADEISRCPAALNVLKPVVYFHDQQKNAEILAANEQYQNAINLLKTENLEDARFAYKRLQWVSQIYPTYKDIENQMLIAKDLSTLKVVVEYLPELRTNFDIDSRIFYYRLYDNLVKSSSRELIRFYKPELAQELGISPNEIVKIQLLEFNINALIERESNNKYDSDSVVVGTYTDNKGIEHNVMGTVKAEATIYERELLAKGVIDITIIDFQTNEIIRTQKFPGEYFWKNQWAHYNGDERAVPLNVKKLAKEKQKMPPSPQEMFLLYSDQLFESSLSFLKSHYRSK